MVSSLDVRLTKETIGHIKNFKLFLSGTRGSKEIKISERDDLEILLSAILRKLGVLSPIKRKIEFSLNGNNVQGIFQEKPAKEFLESLNRREGPILFYDSDNEELTPKFASDSKMRPDLGLIKIANKNWAKRTKSNLNQAIYAYGVGSMEILSQFLRFNTGGPIQTDDSNEVNNVNFAIHEIVSSITMSWHSLYFYNRRFYWDSINETLEPIYYDGSPITLIDITKFENQSNNDFLQKYVTARFSKNILNGY